MFVPHIARSFGGCGSHSFSSEVWDILIGDPARTGSALSYQYQEVISPSGSVAKDM